VRSWHEDPHRAERHHRTVWPWIEGYYSATPDGAFVLLTYLISWSFVIPADGALIPYGPMIAAFIVLAMVAGRSGVAGLWKQMTRWRVGWKWWLLAPGVLIAVHVCALMINIALGARIVNSAHVASLPLYLSATVLPLLLLGGQWEETGWMGYAQRRYQEPLLGRC
jgi:hypothetical protein